MIYLAEKLKCTACGNCAIACGKNAITFHKDELDNLYPTISTDKCIECGVCSNVCPVINSVKRNPVSECYAAYSANDDIRNDSASGGVASTIYNFCLKNNILFSGVYFDNETLQARFKIGNNKEDIQEFVNSKYTFSFMDSIANKIAEQLKNGRKALFIGLPCQVAALKRYLAFKKQDITNLITVDMVCHGVPSHEYLLQHVQDTLHVDKVNSLSFRDKKWKTSKFVFSVSCKGKNYHKFVESNDNYQIGYHNATIYRPNCYKCSYANSQRVGDITIGDFSGLGKVEAFPDNVAEAKYLGVSCVLTNTDNGKQLLKALIDKGLLDVYKRPLEEALLYENQLNKPSVPSKYRTYFEKLYPQFGFTKACNKIFKIEKLKRPIVRSAKDCVKKILGRK